MLYSKLEKNGLNIFAATPVSGLPEELKLFLPEKTTDLNLCLVGHGGRKFWEKLPHPLKGDHPIDEFSIKIVNEIFPDALILFPDWNSKTPIPLQKFGRAMNISRQSQLGIDIHPEFGLWFAFRCLFMTSQKVQQINLQNVLSPCETCFEKPCLNESEFSKARLLCPYKAENQYSIEQLKYHESKLPRLTKV